MFLEKFVRVPASGALNWAGPSHFYRIVKISKVIVFLIPTFYPTSFSTKFSKIWDGLFRNGLIFVGTPS